MNESLWNGMSKAELLDLYNQRQVRRYWTSSQVQQAKATVKKRKVVASRKAPIASNLLGQALTDVQTSANIFRGKIFHVFESKEPPKNELEKLIVQNGGEFAQARTEGNLAIPVGSRLGHPNAQGYKRKDVTILRPAWVVESIKAGRMLPLTKELTLYADSEVQEGPHYHIKLDNLDSQAGLPTTEVGDLTEDEDEDEDAGPDRAESEERKHKQPYPSPPRDVDLGGVWNLRNVKSDRQVEESETEPESNEEQDPDLSDEDDGVPGEVQQREDSSEVVKEEEDEAASPEPMSRMTLPSRVKSESGTEEQVPVVSPTVSVSPEQPILTEHGRPEDYSEPNVDQPIDDSKENVKMGETAQAMNYDQDLIFKHLVFYLDNYANAQENGLDAKKANKEAERELSNVVPVVIRHGGTISQDLFAPNLTHVVQHSDDSKRYKQINRSWKASTLKQIVTPDFIHDSVADARLLDENGQSRLFAATEKSHNA